MSKPKLPVDDPARMMDVEAVATMLTVSTRHVYRLADSGRMPRPVKLGGAVRWDRQSITDWIDAGCPSMARTRTGRRRS